MASAGYGPVDDNESIDAIHALVGNGVNVIDTAPDYGSGYSELAVGRL